MEKIMVNVRKPDTSIWGEKVEVEEISIFTSIGQFDFAVIDGKLKISQPYKTLNGYDDYRLIEVGKKEVKIEDARNSN